MRFCWGNQNQTYGDSGMVEPRCIAFIEHEMVCFGKKVEIFGKTRAIKHGNRLLCRSD